MSEIFVNDARAGKYRNGNYAAFYVKEPVSSSNLAQYATPDLNYYLMLKAWKKTDMAFPFIDSHGKTYNVRDDSTWETLKARLHERLSKSKNIILFLSKNTVESRALKEELEYGMHECKLPVIVTYPEIDSYSDIISGKKFTEYVKGCMQRVPTFIMYAEAVPVIHVPFTKVYMDKALQDKHYQVMSKGCTGHHYFKT